MTTWHQGILIYKEHLDKFKTVDKKIILIELKDLEAIAANVSCNLKSILEEGYTLNIDNTISKNNRTFVLNDDPGLDLNYKNKFNKLSVKETITVKHILREVENKEFDLVIIEKENHE